MILDSMKSELPAWRNRDGIDLEGWTSCEVSFKLAVGYTPVFWPKFQKLDGDIVREGVTLESVRSWEKQSGLTRKQVEQVINHLHIADIQHPYSEDLSKD